METNNYIIRKANISDLGRLTEIYNQAIDAGNCVNDKEQLTIAERMSWFKEHQNERHSIFVYDLDDEVVGYSCISTYDKDLDEIGEINCYVDFNYHGFGIAKKLIEHAGQAAKDLDYTTLLAIVLECNRESISLLKRYKFEEGELLPNVIKPNDEYHSHLCYGLKL